MTSKLIVNSLAADTGVSTITFADQAKMGDSLFHSTGFTIGDSFLHSTGVNLTNINATGVITATKFVGEVSVGSSITFEDNEKAYFGTGTDFSIYHNGSASYLHEGGTGGLIVKTNTAFQVFNSAGSQPAFTVTPGGGIDLYHNTTKMLETTAIGLTINGDVKIIDNENLRLGTGNDMLLYHTGSHSYIENATGNLYIRGGGGQILMRANSAEDGIVIKPDGAVELYHNNTKRLETFDNNPFVGVSVTNDLILNGAGDVAIRWAVGGNASSNFKWGMYYAHNDGHLRLFDNVNSRTVSVWKNTGAIELNYAASKKFETTTNGIQVTGRADPTTDSTYDLGTNGTRWRTAYLDTLNVSANGNNTNGTVANFRGGVYNQINIAHANNSGWGLLLTNTDQTTYGNNTGYHYSTNTGVNKPCAVVNVNSDTLHFATANTSRFFLTHVGHFLPYANNSYDIGSSTNKVRNIYTNDLHLSNEGSTNSVDNTWGDYTIQEGESDLFLINNRSGKKYKFNLTEVS